MNIKSSPPRGTRGNFRVITPPQEEDAFDYVRLRTGVKFTGIYGSIAHVVKGSLGAGILGSHVAYMKAGYLIALPFTLIFGSFMGYCLHLLVKSAQVLYRRTTVPYMSYPDVGEAAMLCFPNPKIARLSKAFRYWIDTMIIMDLFGACACYQIFIAKSIKQLVENTQESHLEGLDGYPSLRIYMVIMMFPIICVCLIRHLKWLAPFSMMANMIVLCVLLMAIYYAIYFNPTFSNLKPAGTLTNFFEFTGMIVFGISCSGVVLPIENNMKNPKKFPLVLFVGMCFVILGTFSVSFFGYVGFTDKCESPITVNFPLVLLPKILKGLIIVMLMVTHGLNFWVPFNLLFYYIQKLHSKRLVMWELIYRAFFVAFITTIAVIFPNVDSLTGFIGCLCLTNMAVVWPNIITLLVVWHRPGLGMYKWRLWRGVFFIVVGCFMMVCGSFVNGRKLLSMLF